MSALGTFWLGAGVSMRHSIEGLINPTVALDKVRAVLGCNPRLPVVVRWRSCFEYALSTVSYANLVGLAEDDLG